MDKLRKPQALWQIILVVSLMLNVAGLGLFAGAAIKGRAFDEPPPRVSFGLGPVTDALDRADRRAISRQVRGKLYPRRESAAQMRELVEVLRADPFVAEDLDQLLQARFEASKQIVSAARVAFVDRVAGMSAQDRQALADRIGRGRR